MLERLPEAEIRQACRLRLEAAEQWIRRLVREKLSLVSPDYLSASDGKGARLIRKSIGDGANRRRSENPNRYPRGVDALLTDELVSILCNPAPYHHFRDALRGAYPQGSDEARIFLMRLVAPRNRLAHANALSLREAEQVVCYAGDVIQSLKEYYARMGKLSDCNVPTILRVTDSLGMSVERPQMKKVHDGGVGIYLHDNTDLRPGDILTIEIEIDPSFDSRSYKIRWASLKSMHGVEVNTTKLVVPIRDSHVGMQ